MPPRAGVTLVELMVVLVVLGVMAGVVGLAWQPQAPRGAGSHEPIATLRRRAVDSGHVVSGVVTIGGRETAVIAYPDGRIVGAERLGVNPLTGQKSDADTVVP